MAGSASLVPAGGSLFAPTGEPSFIFVIGAPGAGKGTLAHMLASQCHFRHVSVGDLLRRVAANPATSDVVRGYVERGELLPSELLFPILRARFDRYLHNTGFNKCIILDGFPRMLSQAVEFERETRSRTQGTLTHLQFGRPSVVIFFDCPRDLAKQRVLNRRAGRAGDTSEVFDRRYDEFPALTPNILDYYRRMHRTLAEVDTSGDPQASFDLLIGTVFRDCSGNFFTLLAHEADRRDSELSRLQR